MIFCRRKDIINLSIGNNLLDVPVAYTEVHGNIDGGHTLRAILDVKSKNTLSIDRYVYMEIIVGLDSPVELAAARNTSVQVDLKSIADLENSFEVIKFAAVSGQAGRRYGTRKYSKFHNGDVVGKSFFEEKNLNYIVPKGIMYPIVGAFRALFLTDEESGEYYWKKSPIDVWKVIGTKLVTILLDEKTENPDVLAKNSNL